MIALLVLRGQSFMPWWLITLVATLSVLPLAIATVQAADIVSDVGVSGKIVDGKCCTIPSLMALHVSYHEPSEQELMRAQIELSPYGLRVRELGKEATQEMLQNFVTEQAWLVDLKRRVFHELPLTADPDVSMLSPGAGASFLGHQPCGDLHVGSTKAGYWRGRTVDKVHCVDGDDVEQSLELLDHEYDIVVYRRDRHGYVDKLQGIQDRSYTSQHFSPPESFRKVGKEEFFFGSPPLRSYTPSQ